MDKFAAQLATYSKFLEPDELRQMERLLRSGQFGAAQTNGLITEAGRSDLSTGRIHLPAGTTDVLGNPVKDTPGVAQSRKNLLDFISRNSQTPAPQAGAPDLAKINQATQSGRGVPGLDANDLRALDDTVNGRPAPQVSPVQPRPTPRVVSEAPARTLPTGAPQPRPNLTSGATPSPAATKVSTTPTAGPKVAAGFRYAPPAATAAAPAPTPALTGMPGTAPGTRMAGQLAEESPEFMRWITNLIKGGGSQAKDAVGGVTQGAKGAAQGANNAVKAGLLRNGGRIIGGTGVLAALGAATEFADTDDPLLRNASQAAGNFSGGLAGAGAGATLGTMILPGVGTVAGGIIGGIMGSNAGSGLGGGIYDMFNNTSPEQRARENLIKNAAVQRQIAVDDIKAQIPLQRQAMEIARNDDFLRAERDLRIQNEYNYANAINQALNNAQQNAAMQQQAISQIMMG